ncbi:PTS fructose transporter subunit IIABC [Gordonia rhizosphera]|uniref:Putative fructose-specific phosphotransferase system enzyme II n=1 Tax=Gordonia rhizosphera NBRC 16068 TaxID=1108045 RepID=K6W7X9_9ACTN|nr:fructose-specific PTS transporter subunit EIIC [Gordonia rhizosphera]GAB88312.1 putative fructose-specific phosphotransferase system enzyme II [Gordonia rhizosphera NBRC 16068]
MSQQIITPQTVSLDVDAGSDPAAVITYLADRLASAGRTTDAAELTRGALDREAKSATGLPGGIAIPHARAESVTEASLAMARLSNKVDFGAPDGPADIVFLIAAPSGGASEHMKLLSSLARALVRPDFVTSLREADSDDRIVELVDEAINPAPAQPAAPAAAAAAAAGAAGGAAAATAAATPETPSEPASKRRSVVAITACPTGIAHTYMAADALKYAAERADVEFHVETQGSSATTSFTPDVIANADAVIFATDVGVKGKERFHGKPVIASGVKRAINEPDKMIAEAVDAASNPNAAVVTAGGGDEAPEGGPEAGGVGIGKQTQQALMTGVSYMIPFVAAGGLLIALAFLPFLGGYEIANATIDPAGAMSDGAYIALHNSLWDLPAGGLGQYIGAVLFAVGGLAMSMLVPALAGYISFAIADRPGIAPGFVAGLVSVAVGASFIGGLVGGLIAGVVCLWISRLPLPQWARGLMPVVIIPLLGSLIIGGLLYMLLGKPLAWLTEKMTEGLNNMSGGSAVILGIVLGLMMCFDLGGPVNKAAYLFATTGLAIGGTAQLEIMAAVMCAGMVPPLAMALATVLRPGLFSEVERENGMAAWLLGASFISEGAIPFAAKDPIRVIPSMMAGGALAGALIMAFGVTQRAPHGGIFVFFTMNHWVLFLVALVAGTVLSAVLVIIAKQWHTNRQSAMNVAELETVPA